MTVTHTERYQSISMIAIPAIPLHDCDTHWAVILDLCCSCGCSTSCWPLKWKWKCVNFKCYSSEELITLNTLHEDVPTWYSFHSWVDWSNADKVSCSRRKHIDAGIEPATFESKVDILSPTPMVLWWPLLTKFFINFAILLYDIAYLSSWQYLLCWAV